MSNDAAIAMHSRRNNFDFLRFTFAVLVLLSHCYPLTSGSEAREPLSRLTGGNENFGSLAVAGFFVISGFLIANSWANSRGILNFVSRRVRRIYPGLIGVVLLSVFVLAPVLAPSTFHLKAAIHQAARAIRYAEDPLIPGLFPNNPIPNAANGSMWTIWFELMCYGMIAALGLLGALRRPRLVLLCFLCSLTFYVMADAGYMGHLGGPLKAFFTGRLKPWCAPRLVALFMAGTCFWAFRRQIRWSGGVAAASVIVLVAAQFISGYAAHALLPVLGTYVLFYVAFSPSIPLQGFGAVGDFSYGVYLYAWPVTQLIVQATHARMAPLSLFFIAFALTLPIAIASWFLVERPFLLKSRKQEHAGITRPKDADQGGGTMVLGSETVPI